MEKIPFIISAAKKGKTAIINIIGEIGWDVDAMNFRADVAALVKEGCTDAHLYINSFGGSCFDANDISNILQENFTRITGDGGAIVASAAAFISMVCSEFSMPKNGQFMTHPPTGGVFGMAPKIKAYLKMIEDMDATYLEAFKKRAKNPDEFQKQWEGGEDNWMTGQEAVDAGFVTSIRDNVKIDQATKNMLRACVGKMPKNRITQILIDNTMDIKELAKLSGLPVDSAEQDHINAINSALTSKATIEADLKKEKDEKKALQDKLDVIDTEKKNAEKTEAETLLVDAIKDGRLDDDEKHELKNYWLGNFATNFEGTKKALAALPKRESARAQLQNTGGESAWTKRQKEIEENSKNK